MRSTVFYRIAGWFYAGLAALFLVALIAGVLVDAIPSAHAVLGVFVFVVPCGIASYSVLRQFPEPQSLPAWWIALTGAYTGLLIYIEWQVAAPLAIPLLLVGFALDRYAKTSA
jgi:hypothetical protein